MRISAIQSRPSCCLRAKANKACKFNTEPPKDSAISFQSSKVTKGAGFGALIGLGALTIISGGAAAPIAYAAYAAIMGTAGGMLGHAIDKAGEENKKDKK